MGSPRVKKGEKGKKGQKGKKLGKKEGRTRRHLSIRLTIK
jgi:hypothetical protein